MYARAVFVIDSILCNKYVMKPHIDSCIWWYIYVIRIVSVFIDLGKMSTWEISKKYDAPQTKTVKWSESFWFGWWFCGFNIHCIVTFKNNNEEILAIIMWRRRRERERERQKSASKTKVIGFIHAVSSSILNWIGCLPTCLNSTQ